jgi:ribosome-binding factor A
MSDGIRRKRLAGTIRRHLSEEFARRVADPRLAALSIQAVEVTADLSIAKVEVRLMFGGETAEARLQVLSTLEKIGPGLRSSLVPHLRMRRLPELRFAYDVGADQQARIADVLDEIKKDDEGKRRQMSHDGAEDGSEG